MFRFLIHLLVVIILIASTECRSQAVASSQPAFCMNGTYVIALFGQKFLRMTLDRARLRQAKVHTVRIRASIADPKVAEFSDHRRSIEQVFHLTDKAKRKYTIGFLKRD